MAEVQRQFPSLLWILKMRVLISRALLVDQVAWSLNSFHPSSWSTEIISRTVPNLRNSQNQRSAKYMCYTVVNNQSTSETHLSFYFWTDINLLDGHNHVLGLPFPLPHRSISSLPDNLSELQIRIFCLMVRWDQKKKWCRYSWNGMDGIVAKWYKLRYLSSIL